MRQRFHFILFAALAAGGLSTAGWLTPQAIGATPDDSSISVNSNALALPPGFQAKNLDQDSNIEQAIGHITDVAISPKHFANLIGNLASADDPNMAGYKNINTSALDAKAQDIATQFKAKYGREVSDFQAKTVLANWCQIAQGQVSDPAMAMTHWPVAITGQNLASANPMPGDQKQLESKTELDKGRDVALVRLPAEDRWAQLDISLVHQFPAQWRVDLPATRTAQDVYNDLLSQLTDLDSHTNIWPTSADDCYRMFSRHVLAALYGVPPTEMPAMKTP